jgi:hypothetical protein
MNLEIIIYCRWLSPPPQREPNGRRNRYTINALLPLPDPIAREQNVGELLETLTATQGSERRVDRAGPDIPNQVTQAPR